MENPLDLTVEDLAEALANAGTVAAEEGRPGITVETGKKKRKSTPREAEPATVSYSGEELTPLVQAIDGWISASFQLTPKTVEQCREISGALAPVLTKYAGASIERWGPEMALIAILAKNYVPTYMEYSMREKLRHAQEEPAIVVESSPLHSRRV